jgi:hypothetical protein
MSTSTKSRSTIRQGGPGASHENAKAPLATDKPPPANAQRRRSKVSGGGGERDRHHGHAPAAKAGR